MQRTDRQTRLWWVMDAIQESEPVLPRATAGRTARAGAQDAGNLFGFDELYRATYTRLVRLAYLLVDTEVEAEEVVQEAFARLLVRWPRVTNREAYLRRAVVNAGRDIQRRRAVRRRHPPERAHPVEVHDDLADAVRRLRPAQREAVVLRFYEDLSIEQISDVLDLRPNTVKSHLHRALLQLRKVIEP
jgi:RNA polymerase sigma factor (sigma-70 family)